jgi:hypothetical protein
MMGLRAAAPMEVSIFVLREEHQLRNCLGGGRVFSRRWNHFFIAAVVDCVVAFFVIAAAAGYMVVFIIFSAVGCVVVYYYRYCRPAVRCMMVCDGPIIIEVLSDIFKS